MHRRTFGWVQNPSDFNKLKLVVQIFDKNSKHYTSLRESLVKDLIPLDSIREPLLEKLNEEQTEFTYGELIGGSRNAEGKAAKSRAEAVADGLIQVTVLPQSKHKKWTDNWTADGYLRWALSFGFVEYDWNTDRCRITELGLNFSQSKVSPNVDEVFIKALLSYPPATRVLQILHESHAPVTKFYIGDRLGFKGERGFTSYTDKGMKTWFRTADRNTQAKLKRDVEGTSDKYARMISKWLEKVGFLETRRVSVQTIAGTSFGFPEYKLTAAGEYAVRRLKFGSKGQEYKKYVTWEFLATQARNRDYVRTRRAHILNTLHSTDILEKVYTKLHSIGFKDADEVLLNDLKGLVSSGINIEIGAGRAVLKDKVNLISIPPVNVTEELKDASFEKIKAVMIKSTNLEPKYYELIDIAYDGDRNRDFEALTADIFRNAYRFDTSLLGGSRKPDGIAYTNDAGIIIDTKAYGNGYSKNISQEDEMVRYIEDNQIRDSARNENQWWSEFNDAIPDNEFYFLWVSSEFRGRFKDQLDSTSQRTDTLGAALNVEQLLIGADLAIGGQLTPSLVIDHFKNEEIEWHVDVPSLENG